MKMRNVLMVLLILALSTSFTLAADVTFQVYTELQQALGNFNPDEDLLVVRGSLNDWAGNDYALEPVAGGMYGLYSGTFDIADGDYEFKFVIAGDPDRWEDNVQNRPFTVAGAAVVLDAVWFDNADATVPVNVTFQVWTSFQVERGNFDPDNGDIVVLRGSMNNWAGNDWELAAVPGDENGLWTATFELTPGAYNYKFVLSDGIDANDRWESSIDDRVALIGGETTIDPVWFDDLDPTPTTDLEILFQVDMSVSISSGAFDPNNDGVIIRGGHRSLGDWANFTPLTRVGATDIWAEWIQLDALPIANNLEYKFVIDSTNNADDPIRWEELPQGGNRQYMVTGDEEDTDNNGYGEVILEPVFFADNPGDLDHDITVNFILDLNPAVLKMADVGIEGIDAIDGVWIAGISGVGWLWGDLPDAAQLSDDGVAPDETAGDNIYALSYLFPAQTAVNQTYKYGINMLDNEAGFGENHYLMLDNEVNEMTVYDIFGEQGDLYDDYMTVHEVETSALPESFVLEQNYPNPFNPSTVISFSIPEAAEVTVSIVNVMGQEVYRYDAGRLNAGKFNVTFNAENFASGTYIYRVDAGPYSSARKMMLLK